MRLQNKLLIATRNQGKLGELKKYLKDLNFQIVSLKTLGVEDDVKENERTYLKNSRKKALFFAKLTNLPTIADDGGIEISALGNKPGIRSRRWLGDDTTEEDLIKHMIKVSKELPENNRKALFKTVISFAMPDGTVWSESGMVEGEIRKPNLKFLKGYPYRSFFYIPKLKKFYHEDELTLDEEKDYNHRYKAINKLKPIIKKQLGLC